MGVSAELLLGVTVALLAEPVVEVVVELSPELSEVAVAAVVTGGCSAPGVGALLVVPGVVAIGVLLGVDTWREHERTRGFI